MELIDRYLQAVRFWLPKTKSQEDVLAELGEDLRSQIEAKESEVGRPLDKNEVGEILKHCGAPMSVAARLAPKRYLIGPTLFPIRSEEHTSELQSPAGCLSRPGSSRWSSPFWSGPMRRWEWSANGIP